MKRTYEMVQLRRPPNRLTPSEYKLYNLAGLSWEAKSQFLGGNATNAISANNDSHSQALTRDKLLTYGILCFHKFPFPDIKAVGHPTRGFPGAISLKSVERVGHYLETEAAFPIFMKPIAGNAGAGSIWVEGYADGKLQLRNGKNIPLSQYFDRWLSREGILLQAVARPHPEIALRCGPRLATARVVVLMSDSGPILHRAVLRIPTGANMIDNFQHGASGNLLGSIEIDTGVVSNVIGKKNAQLKPYRRIRIQARQSSAAWYRTGTRPRICVPRPRHCFPAFGTNRGISRSRSMVRKPWRLISVAMSTFCSSLRGGASPMRPGGRYLKSHRLAVFCAAGLPAAARGAIVADISGKSRSPVSLPEGSGKMS